MSVAAVIVAAGAAIVVVIVAVAVDAAAGRVAGGVAGAAGGRGVVAALVRPATEALPPAASQYSHARADKAGGIEPLTRSGRSLTLSGRTGRSGC